MTRPARGFRVNHELTIEMALARKADRNWVPPDEREEHQRVLSRMEIDDWPWGLVPVTTRSRLGLRRAVFLCALYFRREMHFDFVQYGWNGAEREKSARAYLLTTDHYEGVPAVVGACCFRRRPPWWGLQWVWVHPYERREGHLKKFWHFFDRRFPDFVVEGPISHPMHAFLLSHDPERRVG